MCSAVSDHSSFCLCTRKHYREKLYMCGLITSGTTIRSSSTRVCVWGGVVSIYSGAKWTGSVHVAAGSLFCRLHTNTVIAACSTAPAARRQDQSAAKPQPRRGPCSCTARACTLPAGWLWREIVLLLQEPAQSTASTTSMIKEASDTLGSHGARGVVLT